MAEWGRTTLEMIVEELQRPVRLEESFDRRLMVQVRRIFYREKKGRRRSWLTVGATFGHRAGWAAALAASVVAIASVGMLRAWPRASVIDNAPSAHTFVLVRPEARSVKVVGDFNHWGMDDSALVATNHQGVWSVKAPLRAGLHRYAFVVNEKEWVADPNAPRSSSDDFGSASSAVVVPGGSQ